jgi:TolB protein
VTADGSTTTRLTDDPVDDYNAEWSPDGSRLLFVRGRLEGNLPPDEVYVMQADGSGETSVSPARLQAFSPDWSPDGSRIVFVGQTGPTAAWDLFSVGADGTGLTRLTRSAGQEFDPEWGPARL